MTRPPLEVADIVRAQGNRFIRTSSRWIHWSHRKVLLAIVPSPLIVAGIATVPSVKVGRATVGSRPGIANCYRSLISTSSLLCRIISRIWRWSARRSSTTCCSTAETLLEVAADPEHLGAHIGFLAVLHSWGQNLLFHPHLHCLIPAGGLSPDHTRWIHPRYPFFLPVGVLRRVFRGKFVDALQR